MRPDGGPAHGPAHVPRRPRGRSPPRPARRRRAAGQAGAAGQGRDGSKRARMDRRHLLVTATLGAVARAFGAEAQQRHQPPRRVGLLSPAYYPNSPSVQGLKTGLRALGFAEGRDLVFEPALGEGDAERLRNAAAALVTAQIDVIFAEQAAAAQAAREATERVPVIFSAVGDPVAAGLVKTIAHPGTNVTGVSGLTTE